CHRLRLEQNTAGEAIARQDRELMADEVEIDLERAASVRNGRRGQASGGHVERAMPAMIHPGALCEADLPDDLGPHVQCSVGLAPGLEWQGRPCLGRSGHEFSCTGLAWPPTLYH